MLATRPRLLTAFVVLLSLIAVGASAAHVLAAPVSAADLPTIQVTSSRDGSSQPSLMLAPREGEGSRPLLIVLHTWSGDYQQAGFVEPCIEECRKRGWALVHPNFRGPSWNKESCGSDLAVADVLDVVDHMQEKYDIDSKRIYLVGTSGGAHMVMLLAAKAPERWAAASAWVGFNDLAAWYRDTKKAGNHYWKHIEKVTGGAPGTSEAIDRDYRSRSALPILSQAKDVPFDLNTGIHDGYVGSVPISHSLVAFNVLAKASGHSDQQFSEAQIQQMVDDQKVPPSLAFAGEQEAGRAEKVLLRRSAGSARVTIFEGGHTGDMPTAIQWLSEHVQEDTTTLRPRLRSRHHRRAFRRGLRAGHRVPR